MILNRQHAVRVSIVDLDRFLARVLRNLRLHPDSLAVSLVTNAQMARWNRGFRGKKGATDVLSFPMNGRGSKGGTESKGRKGKIASLSYRLRMMGGRKRLDGGAQERRLRNGFSSTSFASSASYLGDIAIAPVVARENARRLGRTLNDELRVLILHGILHLVGYDHETDNGEMERRELRLRRTLGIA